MDHAGYKIGRGMYFPVNQHVFEVNFHGFGLLEEATRSHIEERDKVGNILHASAINKAQGQHSLCQV